MNLQEKVLKLVEANDAYYNGGTPIMTDPDYDTLYDDVQKEDSDNPVLKTVGAKVRNSTPWEKCEHNIPMGSLNKCKTPVEFVKWVNSYEEHVDLIGSEKMDGLSIDLVYESGVLVKAITRGDGEVGEDIHKNVVNMRNVKKEISNFTGSLRGEIILRHSLFGELSEIMKQRNEEIFKNSRNAAAGIARRFDGKYSEFCEVVYFDVEIPNKTFEYKSQKFEKLEEMFLPTSYISNCDFSTAGDIYSKYDNSKRVTLDYDIDGLVFDGCS
jgi:DNA ligase (NAD+)